MLFLKRVGFFGTLALLLALSQPGFSGWRSDQAQPTTQNDQPRYVPGELIVRFKPESMKNLRQQGLSRLPLQEIATEIKPISPPPASPHLFSAQSPSLNFAHVKLKEGISVDRAIRLCQNDSTLLYAEPNYIYTLQQNIPDDPFFSDLWGLHNEGQSDGTVDADIDAPEAWDIQTGDGSIIVAVIDTGVDYNHQDLAANMWVNTNEIPNNNIDDDENGFTDDYYGYDFINLDGDPLDDESHGTHVAGTIGAVGNNGIGVVGVNWNVKIMALKVLSSLGSGSTDSILRGVEYAMAQGAHVINTSLGSSLYSQASQDVVTEAHKKGIVFVAAAGNSNSSELKFPAAYDHVISVGATTRTHHRAPFSSFGNTVDIAAPGHSVLSTYPDNQYAFFSGTSMASPHVAGVVALLLAQTPALTPDEVENIIRGTADPIIADQHIGPGQINASKALVATGGSFPEARLIFDYAPPEENVVSGFLDIRGTASGQNFKSYSLYYGESLEPTEWILIGEVDEAVDNGFLFENFDTSILPVGFNVIRLVVTDLQDQTAEDRIPIIIRNIQITSPQQNDIFSGNDTVEIKGTVNTAYEKVTVEYGYALDPQEQWFTNGIEILAPPNADHFNGVLATWNTAEAVPSLSSLGSSFYRIRITLEKKEGRPEVFLYDLIHLSRDLKPGWPVRIPVPDQPLRFFSWLEPKVAELDYDDEKKEIVVVEPGALQLEEKALLRVFHADGSLYWERELAGIRFYGQPLILDIDKDGLNEIVIDSQLTFEEPIVTLHVFEHDGQEKRQGNWPLTLTASDPRITGADLDHDGYPELIVRSATIFGIIFQRTEPVSKMWVFDHLGNIKWEKDPPHPRFQSGIGYSDHAAVGNFDQDPELEIVTKWGLNQLMVFNHDGTPFWTEPLPVGGDILSQSPVVGDLDNDGLDNIIISLNDTREIKAFYPDGTLLPGWPQVVEEHMEHSPSLGDLNQNGNLELAVAGQTKVYLFDNRGEILPGWPQETIPRGVRDKDDYVTAQVSLGDIDGDGLGDIVVPSGYLRFDLQWEPDPTRTVGGIWAWNHSGRAIDLNPSPQRKNLFIEHRPAVSVVIDDIDNNGRVELLTTAYDERRLTVKDGRVVRDEPKKRRSLYAWELDRTYHPGSIHWTTFQGNTRHTGRYEDPLSRFSHQPPEIEPVPPQVVLAGETLEFSVTATDPEGTDVTFSVRHLPRWAEFRKQSDSSFLFTWTPGLIQEGQYRVTFTVRDQGDPSLPRTLIVPIEVKNPNQPPVLEPVDAMNVLTSELFTHEFKASDPEDESIFYAITLYRPSLDLNQDEKVDFGDLNLLRAAQGTQRGVLYFLPQADYNFDSRINQLDEDIFLEQFHLLLPGQALDPVTGQFTWEADFSQQGLKSFTVMAFNYLEGNTPYDSKKLDLLVLAPPQIMPLPDIYVNPRDRIHFSLEVNDPVDTIHQVMMTFYSEEHDLDQDGDVDHGDLQLSEDPVEFRRTKDDKRPFNVSFFRFNRRFFWRPSQDQAGTYHVTFSVQRFHPPFLFDSVTMKIHVNNPPEVDLDFTVSIQKGGDFPPISLDEHVMDVETPDNKIVWEVSNSTDLIPMIDENRILTVKFPTPDWIGQEKLIFKAIDESGSSDEGFINFSRTDIIQVSSPNSFEIYSNLGDLVFEGDILVSYESYDIEWTEGEATENSIWHKTGFTLTHPSGGTSFSGELGRLDVGQLPPPSSPDGPFYSFRVILRTPTIISTHTIQMVYLDPQMKPSWPELLRFPKHVQVSDLDQDGDQEIIELNTDIVSQPKLVVRSHTGDILWSQAVEGGFFLTPNALTAPVIGDIDKDGMQEIIFSLYTGVFGNEATVHAFNHDGSRVSGQWPVILNPSHLNLTLADLDQDGDVEILARSMVDFPDIHLIHILDATGSIEKTLTLPEGPPQVRFPLSVGNFDDDPDLEIVTPYGEDKIAVINHDGSLVPGWPFTTEGPEDVRRIKRQISVGDIDGDGYDNVLFGIEVFAIFSPYRGEFYALNHDGSLAFKRDTVFAAVGSPALADFDEDGKLEIMVGEDLKTTVLDYKGEEIWSALLPNSGSTHRIGGNVADVNGDGRLDVVMAVGGFDNRVKESRNIEHAGGIFAWDGLSGTPIDLNTGSQTSLQLFRGLNDSEVDPHDYDAAEGQVILTDLEGNGKMDIVSYYPGEFDWLEILLNQEPFFPNQKEPGAIYAWELDAPYDPSRVVWGTYGHDNQHTGRYVKPVIPNRPPYFTQISDLAGHGDHPLTYQFKAVDPEGDEVFYFLGFYHEKYDVNQDGFVDIADLNFVHRHLGARAGDDHYLARLDFDNNQAINILDVFSVFVQKGIRPEKVVFNTSTGEFEWNAPDPTHAGFYRVSVTAYNQHETQPPHTVKNIQIHIKSPPVLKRLEDPQIFVAGENKKIQLQATDLDNDPILFWMAFYDARLDLNQDKEVNFADLKMIINRFGSKKGELGYIEEADLDYNDEITLKDAAAFQTIRRQKVPTTLNFDSRTGRFSWTPTLAYFGDHRVTFGALNPDPSIWPFHGQTITLRVKAPPAAGSIARPSLSGVPNGHSVATIKYPNIFNPARGETVKIGYVLTQETAVRIDIYGRSYEEVITGMEHHGRPGTNIFHWDGRGPQGTLLPPGVYHYQINLPNTSKKGTIFLVK